MPNSGEKVFEFFREICAIPHGSGNVDKISDYLVSFAMKRGLNVRRDELKNVVIYGEATKGYENEPAIILQGHMDMVAVSDNPEKDMTKEGLTLKEEDGFLMAEDTSLGGDDGIALAYAMAVLDAGYRPHPAGPARRRRRRRRPRRAWCLRRRASRFHGSRA